ncbi:MAG: ATP-binding cassette domain-containing protein [Oscillospiraceae bacterium]
MNGIELKGLTKNYGKVCALDNVSLTFEKNKIYGLLGRNGAGKSTMLNLISNRIFPTSGEIFIDGEPAVENDKALGKVYCMSEKNLLPKTMKFRKAIEVTKLFYPDMDVDYAYALCKKFGLEPKKKLNSFSTGYSSIYKIILALSCNADYVFFDEPILGLDANHRELFYKELLQKYIDNGGTYIISTHLIDECANLFERAVIIKEGKVIVDSDTEDLLAGAYTVSGSAALVDEYCVGKELIGSDVIGGLKSAYVKGSPQNVPQGLEISKASLQNLFVQITND